MNKVLIGWGIDPKFADMFDVDDYCTADGGAFDRAGLFVPGNLRWRYEALYPALSPSVEYVADETQGDTPFDTYSARILIYYLLPMAFVRGKEMLEFSQKVCAVYIIVAVLLTINGLLLVMLDVYNMKDKQKNRPLKGFVQVLQVLLFLSEDHSGFSADRQVSYDLVCRSGRICGCTDAGI